MTYASKEFLAQLQSSHDACEREMRALLTQAEKAGRTKLSDQESATWEALVETRTGLAAFISEVKADVERRGDDNPLLKKLRQGGGQTANDATAVWARNTARKIAGSGGERRDISTGVLDIPSLVLPSVVPLPWPQRLTDLFTNRVGAASNAVEYYVEAAGSRDSKASAVADLDPKPVSTFTVTPVTDRCRVIAHVSEPVPVRLMQDAPAVDRFLRTQMAQGLLDGLEKQVVQGDNQGENMKGLLFTGGTTPVPFNTDAATTLRKGITSLQILGEQPNGIALHPADAETIDTQRWGDLGGLLTGGFENDTGEGDSTNFFGQSAAIRRVISPSVPKGTGIVADWSTMQLFVRESMSLMVNFWSDALFTSNAYIVRAELRAVVGFIRPQAFAICTLTDGC